MTTTAILGKTGESAKDTEAFIKQAEDIGVLLMAYKEFMDDLIPGKRSPRRYQESAEGWRIAAAVSRWVLAAQPKPDGGINKYFHAQGDAQPAAADADLYD